jgi:hypothetical protein
VPLKTGRGNMPGKSNRGKPDAAVARGHAASDDPARQIDM